MDTFPCSLSESCLCSVSCPGHSMMDTLAVALRVAEEAIEEAISKAEAYGDSLVRPLLLSERGGLSGTRCHDSHPQLEQCRSPPGLWSGPPRKYFQGPQSLPQHVALLSPLQDKQNEASYLREHKEELTEELAAAILQKVGGLAPGRAAMGAVSVPSGSCCLCSGLAQRCHPAGAELVPKQVPRGLFDPWLSVFVCVCVPFSYFSVFC